MGVINGTEEYAGMVIEVTDEHVILDVLVVTDTIEQRKFPALLFAGIEDLSQGKVVTLCTEVKPGEASIRVLGDSAYTREHFEALYRANSDWVLKDVDFGAFKNQDPISG